MAVDHKLGTRISRLKKQAGITAQTIIHRRSKSKRFPAEQRLKTRKVLTLSREEFEKRLRGDKADVAFAHVSGGWYIPNKGLYKRLCDQVGTYWHLREPVDAYFIDGTVFVCQKGAEFGNFNVVDVFSVDVSYEEFEERRRRVIRNPAFKTGRLNRAPELFRNEFIRPVRGGERDENGQAESGAGAVDMRPLGRDGNVPDARGSDGEVSVYSENGEVIAYRVPFHRLLRDTGGEVFGWYDTAKKEVVVREGARVDTMFHELGWHATLDWAREQARRHADYIAFARLQKDTATWSKELDAYARGEHKGALHLGVPSAVLQACGLNASEMTITAHALREHLAKHGIKVEDIKNLPTALVNPMMVYEWGEKARSLIAITDLTLNDGRKITVAIKFGREGASANVNEIASVHGKDLNRLLEEATEKEPDFGRNKLKYVDKEKASEWLKLAQTPSVAAHQATRWLNLKGIIDGFQNPSIGNSLHLQKISVFHGSPHRFAPEEGAPHGRFDDSKIGTGEGAQAFGWGHYTTNSEGVAKGYAETLNVPLGTIREVAFDGVFEKFFGSKLRLTMLGYSGCESARNIILHLFCPGDKRYRHYGISHKRKGDWISPVNPLNASTIIDGKIVPFTLADVVRRELDANIRELKHIIEKHSGDSRSQDLLSESKRALVESQLARDLISDEFIDEANKALDIETTHNLYTAEFDTGDVDERLLEWTKELTPEQAKRIAEQIEKEYGKEQAESFLKASNSERGISVAALHKDFNVPVFGSLTPRERSKLLWRAGFVGHKYPSNTIWRRNSDSKGTNYVIYQDSELTITDARHYQRDGGLPVFPQGGWQSARIAVWIR